MPAAAPIPDEALAILAGATIFAVMFDLGLDIAVGEFRWVWRHPALLAKALFSVLVAVPALALAITGALEVSRASRIGILLMAIAPGAPIALKRSLSAGGHIGFAPALQILVTVVAVVSMPASVAALDMVYDGRAVVEPSHIMKQVFLAQLLPLGLGMGIRHVRPSLVTAIEPALRRVAGLLLVVLTVVLVVHLWEPVVGAGPYVALAIALVTLAALATGHTLGGPLDSTRTATAVCSAARNPGLALLVATANGASHAVVATVLAYLLVSALVVLVYVLWRRLAGHGPVAAQG